MSFGRRKRCVIGALVRSSGRRTAAWRPGLRPCAMEQLASAAFRGSDKATRPSCRSSDRAPRGSCAPRTRARRTPARRWCPPRGRAGSSRAARRQAGAGHEHRRCGDHPRRTQALRATVIEPRVAARAAFRIPWVGGARQLSGAWPTGSHFVRGRRSQLGPQSSSKHDRQRRAHRASAIHLPGWPGRTLARPRHSVLAPALAGVACSEKRG